MKLLYEQFFEAAHRLSTYYGKHVNLHGHSFSVVVKISGNIGKSGMIIDTDELKRIIDNYDHATLLRECRSNEELIIMFNEMKLKMVLMNYEPTPENIAKQITEEIVDLECRNVKNVSIQVKTLEKQVAYFGYSKNE